MHLNHFGYASPSYSHMCVHCFSPKKQNAYFHKKTARRSLTYYATSTASSTRTCFSNMAIMPASRDSQRRCTFFFLANLFSRDTEINGGARARAPKQEFSQKRRGYVRTLRGLGGGQGPKIRVIENCVLSWKKGACESGPIPGIRLATLY